MPKKSPNPIADALITHHGHTQKLKHWAKDLHLNYHLLKMRYKRGERGEHLLRDGTNRNPTPQTVTLRFNGKIKTVYEWSRIYRVGFDTIMRRYLAGERDFCTLMGITWDETDIVDTDNRT